MYMYTLPPHPITKCNEYCFFYTYTWTYNYPLLVYETINFVNANSPHRPFPRFLICKVPPKSVLHHNIIIYKAILLSENNHYFKNFIDVNVFDNIFKTLQNNIFGKKILPTTHLFFAIAFKFSYNIHFYFVFRNTIFLHFGVP